MHLLLFMMALLSILTSITKNRIIPKKIRDNAVYATLFIFSVSIISTILILFTGYCIYKK